VNAVSYRYIYVDSKSLFSFPPKILNAIYMMSVYTDKHTHKEAVVLPTFKDCYMLINHLYPKGSERGRERERVSMELYVE